MKSYRWWATTQLEYIVKTVDIQDVGSEEEAQDEPNKPKLEKQHQQETTPPAQSTKPKATKWVITSEKVSDSCKEHNCMLSDLTETPKATFGDLVFRVEMEEPRQELQKKAETELRETEKTIRESIPELQKLLREESEKNGLKVPLDNEAWLKMFLRSTHYYPDSAFRKVKNYYQFKIKYKKLYECLKPSTEKNLFENNFLTVLPKRDKEGRRVMVVRIGDNWNPKKCSLDEIHRGAVLFLEVAILEPETQISGCVIIFDMEGLSWGQIWHFNLGFVRRAMELLQDTAPVRIKGLHIVNESGAFSQLLALFSKFMQDKFKKRLHRHGPKREELVKSIGSACLPPEYGGTLDVPLITGPEWYQALTKLDKEYDAVSSYGYNKDIK